MKLIINNKAFIKKNNVRRILICIFLILICFFINKKYDILALFIDDLNSFTYFPNANIFEYAFKFYEGMTHYRPFYEFFQYIAFFIAGHNPHILFIINLVINSFIAFYIFQLVGRITNSGISSMSVSVIYLVSHFSCYQINQATGLMESIGTFLAIYILSKCFMIVNGTSFATIIKMVFAYFCIILTHERYIVLFGLIIFSLLLSMLSKKASNVKVENNNKILLFGVVSIIVVLILAMVLRYFATGKIIPAGTSGTRVEETFELSQFFEHIKQQFLFIFGFNVGDEASCGITYDMLKKSTKMMINSQVIFIFLYIIIYIILKSGIIINKISNLSEKKIKFFVLNIKDDLLFIGFILSCISVSSITVMLEIRFIYVSFIVFIIYLVYMYSYIKREYYVSKTGIYLIAGLILFLSLFFRVAVEFRYRDGNDNIYYMIDQRRLNSLAKETVYKYGNDVIDNKKIYILNNSFFYTKRYAQYLLQIYQKNYEIREIELINNVDEVEGIKLKKGNAIILVEDKKQNKYYEMR